MSGFQTGKYTELYDKYKYHELTFSGTIQKSSGIILRDIFLMAGDLKWPCTIRSVSMTGIKVSANLSTEEISVVTVSSSLQVHFSFMGLKPYFIPISFHVPYKLTDLTNPSNQRGKIHLLTMTGTDALPDFLIKILGELIGIQIITTKRVETRITVNTVTAKELGLKSTHCQIRINDTRHECSLMDLSFSGCQIFLNSMTSIMKKKIFLEILINDPDTLCEIPGRVIHSSPLMESGDKVSAGIMFEKEQTPHEYTMMLHSLLD